MWINLPKSLLHGLDRDHLRLLDANCGAQETRTQFILHTKLTECETISKHTRGFVLYSNKVLEIPLKKNGIITRVREVEIPFSCYYSNKGVVSAVGIKVQSKKILFSKKGFGKFVLEMNIFPDNSYVGFYGKNDFPLIVSLRKMLYVQVKVESEDKRLAILAEECFATPDVNPLKPGLKYPFIKDGYVNNLISLQFISSFIIWHAPRAGKMERYCPLGIARFVPAITFRRSPSGCTKVFFRKTFSVTVKRFSAISLSGWN